MEIYNITNILQHLQLQEQSSPNKHQKQVTFYGHRKKVSDECVIAQERFNKNPISLLWL